MPIHYCQNNFFFICYLLLLCCCCCCCIFLLYSNFLQLKYYMQWLYFFDVVCISWITRKSIEMKIGILDVLQILLLWVRRCLSMCNTAVFYGDELASYGFGRSHPFNSNRIYSFWSKFVALNIDKSNQITIEKPKLASKDALLQFHDKHYVDLVE